MRDPRLVVLREAPSRFPVLHAIAFTGLEIPTAWRFSLQWPSKVFTYYLQCWDCSVLFVVYPFLSAFPFITRPPPNKHPYLAQCPTEFAVSRVFPLKIRIQHVSRNVLLLLFVRLLLCNKLELRNS